MGLRQMEPKKVTVGGIDFYIKPFPAMKSANLSGELAAMLLPLFTALIPLLGKSITGEGKESESDNGLLDIEVEDAAPELGKAFSSLSGDKVELLLRKLLIVNKNIVVEIPDEESGETEQTTLDEDTLNEIFCGEVQDMFILAFEVIRLNFNGFFKKVGALSGKAGKVATQMMRKIY